MRVDVLVTAGCAKCQLELGGLRTAAREADPAADWRELDILQSIDYAVELGVLKAPAIAIDGELVFPTLPTPEALAAAMRVRRGSGS